MKYLPNVCRYYLVRQKAYGWSTHAIQQELHLLPLCYFFYWHAFYWTNCHTCLIVGIYTNDDISTTKVVEIISESTYTMIYAPRIPTFLKLNAVDSIFCLLSRSFIFIASAITYAYFISNEFFGFLYSFHSQRAFFCGYLRMRYCFSLSSSINMS